MKKLTLFGALIIYDVMIDNTGIWIQHKSEEDV